MSIVENSRKKSQSRFNLGQRLGVVCVESESDVSWTSPDDEWYRYRNVPNGSLCRVSQFTTKSTDTVATHSSDRFRIGCWPERQSQLSIMVRKSNIKEVIEILGIFSMFALSVFAYLIWWLAFQQGGRIWINVNFVGEMWIEYALWGVITPLITLSMYYYLKQENRTRKADLTEMQYRRERLSIDSETKTDD